MYYSTKSSMFAATIGAALLAGCDNQDRRSGGQSPSVKDPVGSVEVTADKRPSLLFLGDSLTSGLGLNPDQTYPSLVQEHIDNAGAKLRVINAGRSGDTSASGLARIDWYLRDELRLAAVAINFGSNDAIRGLSLAQLENNLVAMVARVKAKSPDTKVFIFQMETFPNMGSHYTDTYRYVFGRAADKSGATLLPFPLARVAGVANLNQADGIHPTAEGMKLVAESVWKSLQPFVSVEGEQLFNSELVDVTQIVPEIVLDMRYAGTANFANEKMYSHARCLLRKPIAEALARVQEKLRQQKLGLKVWDCYRPFSVQEKLWEQVSKVQYVAKPIRDETGKPRDGSKHSRGAAVDLTLVDASGTELPMPSDFDDFSSRAHRGRGDNPGDVRQNNAKLLEQAMVAESFLPLLTEWWHFDGPGWRNYPLSDQPLR